jgi:hypothetical protein
MSNPNWYLVLMYIPGGKSFSAIVSEVNTGDGPAPIGEGVATTTVSSGNSDGAKVPSEQL